MKHLLYLGSAIVVALVLGTGSAWWAVAGFGSDAVRYGSWKFYPKVGSSAASDLLRARMARSGLLALNRSEAIYFFADRDDRGDTLRRDCTYRLEGRDPDARWWSITAYASDLHLIPNPLDRYSYNDANVDRAPDGGYAIYLSGAPKDGNWIPTGGEGAFDLALRIYNPGPSLSGDLGAVELPRIIREGRCADR
jgi:hypothetical protein